MKTITIVSAFVLGAFFVFALAGIFCYLNDWVDEGDFDPDPSKKK